MLMENGSPELWGFLIPVKQSKLFAALCWDYKRTNVILCCIDRLIIFSHRGIWSDTISSTVSSFGCHTLRIQINWNRLREE